MAKAQAAVGEEARERAKYKSPYEQWKESEGLPTIRGLSVKNLMDIELTPWNSSDNGSAVFINLDGTGGFNDAYVCEISPGKSLHPHFHSCRFQMFRLA